MIKVLVDGTLSFTSLITFHLLDQQTAFDLAKNGHNLVVIVQGGCGKTFLIKQIVNYLRSKGKTVTIACSTGIASTHYGKLGGTTLHKWSGIGDDRYLNEEMKGY
jgi:hypothetical protein